VADYGVAVTWSEPRPGREKASLDLWGEAISFNEKLVADGQVERWDGVAFEPSGTGPGGAVRYYGTAEQIQALVTSAEFSSLIVRGQLFLSTFGFRRFVTGQAMAEEFGRFTTIIDSL
jgi:hypothetical protein